MHNLRWDLFPALVSSNLLKISSANSFANSFGASERLSSKLETLRRNLTYLRFLSVAYKLSGPVKNGEGCVATFKVMDCNSAQAIVGGLCTFRNVFASLNRISQRHMANLESPSASRQLQSWFCFIYKNTLTFPKRFTFRMPGPKIGYLGIRECITK